MSNHPPHPRRVVPHVANFTPHGAAYGPGAPVASSPTSDDRFAPPPAFGSYQSPSQDAHYQVMTDPSFMAAPFSSTTPESASFGAESRGRGRDGASASWTNQGTPGRQSEQSRPYAYVQSGRHDGEGDHSSLWTRSMRLLERDQNSRNFFMFSLLLGVYALVQMAWAVIVESHSLFATSFWSLYMSISLGVTFMMFTISKERPSPTHQFGYNRVEVVATFTNGSLLLFAGLYSSFEALEGLVESTHAHEHLFQLFLAVFGIILHSIAATVVPEALKPRTESSSALISIAAHGNQIANLNKLRSSSLEVKIFALLSHMWAPIAILVVSLSGSSFVDALVATIFSIYLFYVSIPLCWRSGRVLLQGVPASLLDILEQSILEVSRIEGVKQVVAKKTHFWTFSPGVHVGAISIETHEGANEEFITQTVIQILKPYIYHLTVQVGKKTHEHQHDHSGHKHSHNHSHHHDHNHEDHDHDHHNHDHGHHDHSHDHSHDHDHDHDHDLNDHDHGHDHDYDHGDHSHGHYEQSYSRGEDFGQNAQYGHVASPGAYAAPYAGNAQYTTQATCSYTGSAQQQQTPHFYPPETTGTFQPVAPYFSPRR